MKRGIGFLLVAWIPLVTGGVMVGQALPVSLKVRVVEGEGTAYPAGSRATRGVTVEVTAEDGSPVGEAGVTFHLPESGAGGVFGSGTRTQSVFTGADGRASVWGMRWNNTPGPFQMEILAVKGTARASTVCSMSLVSLARVNDENGTVRPQTGPPKSHKWLWITLAAGAAAGGGFAASGRIGSQSASAAALVNAPHLGTPTVAIGHP